MILRDTPFELIHVGKCGGGTVSRELRSRGYNFGHIHMSRPVFSTQQRYVVLVRDPVSRFVSAFNWRLYLYETSKLADPGEDAIRMLRQQSEYAFLRQFADIHDLAERLIDKTERESSHIATMMALIAHVQQGFGWYLDELLDHLRPHQLLGVIAMENFASDFERLFGFRPERQENRSPKDSNRQLTLSARTALARLFSMEYRTLARLAIVARQTRCPISVDYSTLESLPRKAENDEKDSTSNF